MLPAAQCLSFPPQVFELDSGGAKVASWGSWTDFVDGPSPFQFDFSWLTPLLAAGVTKKFEIDVDLVNAKRARISGAAKPLSVKN
jgi:hypothetical protein